MGIFDKAKDALGDNLDKVESGIDKAADFVNDRTGGAHTDQISSGADLAKDRLPTTSDHLTRLKPRIQAPAHREPAHQNRLTGTARLTVDWNPSWEGVSWRCASTQSSDADVV